MAIGDDAPQVVLSAVQIFLNEGLRTQTPVTGWRAPVEIDPEALDVDRRRLLS